MTGDNFSFVLILYRFVWSSFKLGSMQFIKLDCKLFQACRDLHLMRKLQPVTFGDFQIGWVITTHPPMCNNFPLVGPRKFFRLHPFLRKSMTQYFHTIYGLHKNGVCKHLSNYKHFSRILIGKKVRAHVRSHIVLVTQISEIRKTFEFFAGLYDPNFVNVEKSLPSFFGLLE